MSSLVADTVVCTYVHTIRKCGRLEVEKWKSRGVNRVMKER